MNNSSAQALEDDDETVVEQPRFSADSQALIGLKLRELYDDVVAEPVPDRLLELLNKLGQDSSKTE